MMDRLDKMISEALDDEDREILERIGWEQSSFDMAGDMFRGKISVLNLLLIFGMLVFFGIGLYAAWKAYNVVEVVNVVRWGLAATFFLLTAVIAKVGLLPSFQANRMLHAIRRLEMQIALLAAKR
ncbi:DUF6768 family protein [Hoeflea sp. TYP-13]|uniref:DUF6768 family protein n=1 Tax=Hoeflea sp. TYP-13 TaxID=3230023 RepID=UPI0034C5B377